MKVFNGIPASAGIASGCTFVYRDIIPDIPRYSIGNTNSEWERLLKAVAKSEEQCRELYELAGREMGREQADIFQAHLIMLQDPELLSQLKNRLETIRLNIEWVVWDTSRDLSQKLMNASDPAFRERASDITDVSQRLIKNLMEAPRNRFSLADLDTDVILVAHDLLPSDVLVMNKAHVKGLAMDEGSRTSHTAILARAFNVPAVLGLSTFSEEVSDGQLLALNGSTGVVVLEPDKRTLIRHQQEEKELREQTDKLGALKDLPAQTTDGYQVSLKANIELPEEAAQALQYGAEGIGLYRSEFLFLEPGKFADEETQFSAYTQVIAAMGNLPVTIRTVDMGGDKALPGFQSIDEKNPLLGWRAIRFSLAQPELFKVQLRAILRASVGGNVRIMFPMISGVEELEQALALLELARSECRAKGQRFSENIETGVMIEIPSAAMTADILAEKAGFFSIGTNDLIQYSLAVDRGNEKVGYLGDPSHPAVLRFIKNTIDAAHNQGIKAAMCGELAGDPWAAALLLGLGLDEFSMAASSIPIVKYIIRNTSMEICRNIAQECMRERTIGGVKAVIRKWMSRTSAKNI
ncbi:MAG: phosphoenolpyruvate--protein phosphotransferase [Treponema sp.]|nr:phosphoenolpyruvate--protein phosphotransferase [Treponema sp.]